MPSPEDAGSAGSASENHRLNDPLEDYLLAKSKAGGTGNYRRNAERVIHDWIDFTAQYRDVQTFEELDSAALESYALYLKRRVNGGGIAASTARKYYDYVRAYIGWCVSREYATDNPAATDRAEEALPDDDQRSEHRQQLWSPEQRRAIVEYVDRRAHEAIDERGFNAIAEARDRAFVATIAYSGARGGELVRDPNDARREGIQWKDIDLDDGTMWVLDKGDQEYMQASLPRQAVSALRRYREVLNPPTDEWPVFPTLHAPTLARTARDGLREQGLDDEEIEDMLEEETAEEVLYEYEISPPAITTDGARRLMKRLSAAADVPGLNTEADEYLELHGGRRGAGDTLVREVGWEAAQRLLRHKSPETTMDAYSHISASEIAEDAGDAFEKTDR